MKNINAFIANRINSSQSSAFTPIVMRIAIGSVASGLAIMILSFCILEGFKDKIQEKILSFAGHIEITRFSLANAYENPPISTNSEVFKYAKDIPEITRAHAFAYKPGLLKTDEETKGVILKGLGPDYDWTAFERNVLEGNIINYEDSFYSKSIMISEKLAGMLKIELHDTVLMYFIQEPVRTRKVNITGIYRTGLEDFDENIVIGDIRLIQRLNNWADTTVGGFELFVKDFDKLDIAANAVFDALDYAMQLEIVTDKYPQMFEWMRLLNRNVALIIGIILIVATFNMISTLIVLIMERTNMIGILKALGARDRTVKRIFVNNGLIILGKGMFYGNVLALGLAALQFYFSIIPLDEVNYYMDAVPIAFDWFYIIGVNVLTVLIVGVFLFLPVEIISRIRPVDAIKFN